MKNIDYYLGLLGNIDRMYIDLLSEGNFDIDMFQSFCDEIVLVNGVDLDQSCKDIYLSIKNSCLEKIKLVNYLLDRRKKNFVNIDNLRKEFVIIEQFHFNIINSYIMGILKKSEIDRFELAWGAFKEKLYQYEALEEEILEIAKMKSKIQHFSTDILEDEEVLRVAYSNQ